MEEINYAYMFPSKLTWKKNDIKDGILEIELNEFYYQPHYWKE